MKAVAEKVSAARELARRLAEEKEAAVKTGKQYRYPQIVPSCSLASRMSQRTDSEVYGGSGN